MHTICGEGNIVYGLLPRFVLFLDFLFNMFFHVFVFSQPCKYDTGVICLFTVVCIGVNG